MAKKFIQEILRKAFGIGMAIVFAFSLLPTVVWAQPVDGQQAGTQETPSQEQGQPPTEESVEPVEPTESAEPTAPAVPEEPQQPTPVPEEEPPADTEDTVIGGEALEILPQEISSVITADSENKFEQLQTLLWGTYSGEITIEGDIAFEDTIHILHTGTEPLELTIRGNGGRLIAPEGDGVNRHFYVTGDVHIVFENITLDGGGHGGGVQVVSGNVQINGAVIENCAQVDLSGGAMSVPAGSKMVVTNSSFRNNNAVHGGAIKNEGELEVTESIFEGNAASDSGAAVHNMGMLRAELCTFKDNIAAVNGGALANTDGDATLTKCVFAGNRAETGGAVHNSAGRVECAECTFEGNGAASGGAAYNSGKMLIGESSFVANEAEEGVLLNANQGRLDIFNSTVYASRGGGLCNEGAAYAVLSTFAANEGGGIVSNGPAMGVLGCLVVGNTVVQGGQITADLLCENNPGGMQVAYSVFGDAIGFADGWEGISNTAGMTVESAFSAELVAGRLVQDGADLYADGVLPIDGGSPAASGATIAGYLQESPMDDRAWYYVDGEQNQWLRLGGTETFAYTADDNLGLLSGGVIRTAQNKSGDSFASRLEQGGYAAGAFTPRVMQQVKGPIMSPLEGDVWLVTDTSDNVALPAANTLRWAVQQVETVENRPIVIDDSLAGQTITLQGFIQVKVNTTITGPVNADGAPAVTIGGVGGTFALFHHLGPTVSTLQISNVIMDRASGASSLPSCILSVYDLVLNNVWFRNGGGSSSSQGGAVRCIADTSPVTTPSVRATNCLFDGNTAAAGGALFIQNGSAASFVNCTFVGNRATSNGGALRILSTPLEVFDCTFASNTAASGPVISLGTSTQPAYLVNNILAAESGDVFEGGAGMLNARRNIYTGTWNGGADSDNVYGVNNLTLFGTTTPAANTTGTVPIAKVLANPALGKGALVGKNGANWYYYDPLATTDVGKWRNINGGAFGSAATYTFDPNDTAGYGLPSGSSVLDKGQNGISRVAFLEMFNAGAYALETNDCRVVNTELDSADGNPFSDEVTLRTAVRYAKKLDSETYPSITFADNVKTVTLSSALTVGRPLRIDGGGKVLVTGTANGSVLSVGAVTGDPVTPVILENLSVVGNATAAATVAIQNTATNVQMINCAIHANNTGGSIAMTSNAVQLVDSTVSKSSSSGQIINMNNASSSLLLLNSVVLGSGAQAGVTGVAGAAVDSAYSVYSSINTVTLNSSYMDITGGDASPANICLLNGSSQIFFDNELNGVPLNRAGVAATRGTVVGSAGGAWYYVDKGADDTGRQWISMPGGVAGGTFDAGQANYGLAGADAKVITLGNNVDGRGARADRMLMFERKGEVSFSIGAFAIYVDVGLIVDTTKDVVKDDGLTSLREAIAKALTGDPAIDGERVVIFDTTVFPSGETKTISLSMGAELVVDDSAAVEGKIAINGENSDIIVKVPTTYVENNASASAFRVLNVKSDLDMSNLTLQGGNVAGDGGTVYVDGANLVMDNVNVSDSRAANGGGVAVNGGSLEFKEGAIEQNNATANGGGVYMAGADVVVTVGADAVIGGATTATRNAAINGGGVYVGAGTLTVQGAVAGNSATDGGGIYSITNTTLLMDGGQVAANAAGTNGKGGGIYSVAADGSNVVSLLDGAVVGGSAATDANTANLGAGIYMDGGALDANDGKINGNKTSGAGGGAYLTGTGSPLTATFQNGSEINGNAVNSTQGARTGAGVYAEGSSDANRVTLTFTDSAVSDNTTNANTYGIGLYLGDYTTTAFTDSAINTNANTGSTACVGGGVYISGSNATVSFNGGTVTGNTVGSMANALGGGLYAAGGVQVTVAGTQVSENTANRGGGLYLEGADTEIQVKNGAVIGGTAVSDANTAVNGGGIYMAGGTFRLFADAGETAGSIAYNKATSNGGGLYVAQGSAAITGAAVDGNTANALGGGIYATGANARVDITEEAQVANNRAANGGASALDAGATVVVEGSVLKYNTATMDGGGVQNNATLEMINSTVYGNGATANGGGIRNMTDGNLHLISTTVAANYAANGGGIYTNSSAYPTVVNDLLVGNYTVGGAANDLYTNTTNGVAYSVYGVTNMDAAFAALTTLNNNQSDAQTEFGATWDNTEKKLMLGTNVEALEGNTVEIIPGSFAVANGTLVGSNTEGGARNWYYVDYDVEEDEPKLWVSYTNAQTYGFDAGTSALYGLGGVDADVQQVALNRDPDAPAAYMSRTTGVKFELFSAGSFAVDLTGQGTIVTTPLDLAAQPLPLANPEIISLRQAIYNADSIRKTVRFSKAVFNTGTGGATEIVLNNDPGKVTSQKLGLGEVGIDKAVTILGPTEDDGAGNRTRFLTIRTASPGTTGHRVFRMPAGVNGKIDMRNLTLRGGNVGSENGGVLYAEAESGVNLTLAGVVVKDGKAANGGGVYMAASGTVNRKAELHIVGNCVFANNVASGAGGGIYSGATMNDINNDAGSIANTFDANQAQSGGGMAVVAADTGNNTEVSIVNGIFKNQTASAASGDIYGGGLWIQADGTAQSTNITITDSAFNGNAMRKTAIGGAYGAGLAIIGSDVGTVQLGNLTFDGNNTQITISNPAVMGNANALGGGLYINGGTATLDDSSFEGNAVKITAGTGVNAVAGGGGFAFGGNYGDITVDGTALQNNQAGSGGAGYIDYTGSLTSTVVTVKILHWAVLAQVTPQPMAARCILPASRL